MDSFLNFINSAITPFHTVARLSSILKENGFTSLSEMESWEILEGGRYFVTRNSSSLIAFCIPKGGIQSFQIAAAHSDSPCFCVKRVQNDGNQYARLCVEKYGGALLTTWFDRPLTVGGRVFVKEGCGVKECLVTSAEKVVIPSVSIHQNRNANSEKPMVNPASDLMPLVSDIVPTDFLERMMHENGIDEDCVLSYDLYLCSASDAFLWSKNRLITAPRLDDLMCAYALCRGLIKAAPMGSASMLCIFDNEEMGSLSKQGADSTFLEDTLSRIAESIGKTKAEYKTMLAKSFMLSADNGHAIHPNHPELSDKEGGFVRMNQGIVIKHAPAKYATDAFSEAMLIELCRRHAIPYQTYYNRADMPGGSTLANISAGHVSVPTVDIGLAQLAMHSAMETAGAEDLAHLTNLSKHFFSTALLFENGVWSWRSENE